MIRLLAICAIFAFAFTANADDMPWKIDEVGQLFVTGEVDCVELEIPYGVRRISENAFVGWKSIEHVHFPESLVGIHSFAFADCSRLMELKLPESVSEIYLGAFYGCKALERVELPDALREIRAEVFMGCSSLREIVLSAGITNIGEKAFANCKSLCRVYERRGMNCSKDATAFENCPPCLEFIQIDDDTNKLQFVEVPLDPNGGELDERKIRTIYGHNYGLLPTPQREGFAFDGWWTAAEGGSEVASTTKVEDSSPGKLYAHWRKLEFAEFTTGGDAEWTQISDGLWESGKMDGGQNTWLKLVVSGSGKISFDWELSRKHPYYSLTFSVDGETSATISGVTEWKSEALELNTGGVHVFRWEYEKSPVLGFDDDCGRVKNIVWTPDAEPSELEFADADVAKLIGSDAEKQKKFMEWANGVEGGASAVVTSRWAAVSYLLGAKKLFGNEPRIRISECAVVDAAAGNGREFSMTLQFLDGEEIREVSAESVAGLFELSNDLRHWEGKFEIPQKTEGMGASHSFTVVPSGSATRVFLRVRASTDE